MTYSSDLTINVEYLKKPVTIPSPTKLNNGSEQCDTVSTISLVTLTALALLTDGAIPSTSSRGLKTAEHVTTEAATCKCKSKPRPCVFFLGIVNYHEMEELQDTPIHTNGGIGNILRVAQRFSTRC